MQRFKNVLWMALAAVFAMLVFPEAGLTAVPTQVTSGAHSVPLLHWGWLAAAMGPLMLGEVVTAEGLEKKLLELKDTLKGYFDKAAEEQKATGTLTDELKTKIDAVQKQCDAIDEKLAEKIAAGAPEETLLELLEKDENVKRVMKDRVGNAVLQLDAKMTAKILHKTAITSDDVGVQTTGVLSIERTPGITLDARRSFTVRDLLSARPTTAQVIDFIRVNSPMTIASPQQGEGHTKHENAVTFQALSERVKTLATWIPASRQILDDFTELDGFLRSSLAYAVDLREEQQLLSGSGSGEDLNGLITQGTAFDTGLLPLTGTYNRIDVIGRAIQQITSADEIQPTFIVLNPVDWWAMRLTKDNDGRYILGDPQGALVNPQIFGLTVVSTNAIASGTFLVGTGLSIASEIRDRMGMTVEIATQHGTYFTENMVALRAEKRLALIVKRPASYITGSFVTSP